jgi:hypothetical protein
MSPEAGMLLVNEITPRLRASIPHSVHKVGAEDDDELVQDAVVCAARMLNRMEGTGKAVTPGNIAFYCLLHSKAGRRSYSTGKTDVMGSGTQMSSRSAVMSMNEEIGFAPELDAPIELGHMLAEEKEDPAIEAARNIDWDAFLYSHDYRYMVIAVNIMEGRSLKETAEECGSCYQGLRDLRQKMAEDLRAFMGADALNDSLRPPQWRAGIMADRERAACKAGRRRQ